jgi:hypothetical protein
MEAYSLKQNLIAQCPCGYFFGTFNDEKDAIAVVRLHFERFHNDFLPFGITDAEVLYLLRKTKLCKKEKDSAGNSCSVQAQSVLRSINPLNNANKKSLLEENNENNCVFC